MNPPALPTVKEIKEEDLRTVLFKNPKAIVKYHSPVCPYAEHIALVYNDLANHHKYREISFFRINAHENPVALNAVKLKNSPFILTYNKGLLIDCANVTSEDEVIKLLDKLARH